MKLEQSIIRPEEHDFYRVREVAYALKGKYPFLKLGSIGKSVLGRELLCLQIGKAEEAVLYAGAFHGMERLTTLVLLRFVEALCDAIQNDAELAGVSARRALFGRSLIVVPDVNPDGCDIALCGAKACGYAAARIYKLCAGDFSEWNANARGVDINHNFDAGWKILREMEKQAGIYGPAPRRYGGPRPESEPETCALTTLCRQNNIRTVMAFHSQGEEIYWSYGKRTPTRARKMAEILAASSGYAVEEPMGLASHGGFKDWFIEEFGRPGFTIEIGRGKNPLPPSDLDAVYARIEEMMLLGCFM